MTREIKFRAWHEHGKRMVYGPSDDVISPSWVLAMCSANNIEPMQYTGLKDKSGIVIYEGDLLGGMEVYWSEDWAMFAVKGSEGGALMRFASIHEITGNIYETDVMNS